MKLRNKKTGEIGLLKIWDTGEIYKLYVAVGGGETEYKEYGYKSLNELNDEWEDVEPEEVWYIDFQGGIRLASREENDWFKESEIGNYFKTKEEAEKAVEKLKAWKRLKDKGFSFMGKTYKTDKRFGSVFYEVDEDTYSEDIIDDLDLLFNEQEYTRKKAQKIVEDNADY